MLSISDSLNKGIKAISAAIKNIIIEDKDTNFDNFNKITYNAMQIKKI